MSSDFDRIPKYIKDDNVPYWWSEKSHRWHDKQTGRFTKKKIVLEWWLGGGGLEPPTDGGYFVEVFDRFEKQMSPVREFAILRSQFIAWAGLRWAGTAKQEAALALAIDYRLHHPKKEKVK